MSRFRKKSILGVAGGMSLLLAGCGASKLEFIEDVDSIVAGDSYVAIVRDGDVLVACEDDSYHAEMRETAWENAVRLIKNTQAPAGISEAGTILPAKGESIAELEQTNQETMEEIMNAQGNVGASFGIEIEIAKEMMQWTSLQQFYGNYPNSGGYGLCKDGTIVRTETNYSEMSEAEIAQITSWKNIQDMALIYYGSGVAGLSRDGVVPTVNLENINWTNMQAIESGVTMLFGLTKDGKVLHSDAGYDREYATEAMQNIVFIAVGYDSEENVDVVYGITNRGKVVDRFGTELVGFEDIVELDVTTMSPTVVIGRKADGTICISENASDAMKQTVAMWNETE